MKFLDTVEEVFDTRDLYEVLGLTKEAKESEIKRAYYKLSLKVHPDRVELDKIEEATLKFQVLSKIYSILSDTNKRDIYNETGCIPDEDDDQLEKNWVEMWKDVKKFEEKYKGSEEEMEDLRSAYIDCNGDMNLIMESIMCAGIDDEPRFRGLIAGWIAEGSVPSYPSFVNETEKKQKKRKRKYDKEAEEAKAMRKEMGLTDEDESLKMLIRAKQEERDVNSFFDQLAEKYAPKSKKQKTQNNSEKQRKKGKKK